MFSRFQAITFGQQICQKSVSEKECVLGPICITFWLHFGSLLGPKFNQKGMRKPTEIREAIFDGFWCLLGRSGALNGGVAGGLGS